jgi:hypothetical protein
MSMSLGTGLRRRIGALAAVGVAGASGALYASTASGASVRYPPCSKQALIGGLRRGATPFARGRVVRPWACAGRFAYASVVVDGNELTVLFRADGRHWKTAGRSTYCADGAVPARIRQIACNTD